MKYPNCKKEHQLVQHNLQLVCIGFMGGPYESVYEKREKRRHPNFCSHGAAACSSEQSMHFS